MTKFQLVQKVMERLNSTDQQKAKKVVDTLFNAMKNALAKGERIEIRDFGNFTVRTYKPYQGRNPKTGQKVKVEPKKLPFFKVGKDLKERVDRHTHSPLSN
jgi:integration host factor subunit beta